MLTKDELNLIKKTIESDSRFIDKINDAISYTGKETGHSNASPMEDVVRDILIDKLGAKESDKDRSLADIYLNGNYINVKFGSPKIAKKTNKPKYGQPNMCSMNRIMSEFYSQSTIDSYYIIKVNINNHTNTYSLNIFDMFDYIDYLTWNSGTGQIMIKESEFYKDVDTYEPQDTMGIKKSKIKSLYDDGMEKHILLRVEQYLKNSDTDIDNFKKKLLGLIENI
jgi:hypothetical protein